MHIVRIGGRYINLDTVEQVQPIEGIHREGREVLAVEVQYISGATLQLYDAEARRMLDLLEELWLAEGEQQRSR